MHYFIIGYEVLTKVLRKKFKKAGHFLGGYDIKV